MAKVIIKEMINKESNEVYLFSRHTSLCIIQHCVKQVYTFFEKVLQYLKGGSRNYDERCFDGIKLFV